MTIPCGMTLQLSRRFFNGGNPIRSNVAETMVDTDFGGDKLIRPGARKNSSGENFDRIFDVLSASKNTNDIDIEEGRRIVTANPGTEDPMLRQFVHESKRVSKHSKKGNFFNGNEPRDDEFTGQCDDQRIIEVLAKMEKRKERFKEPIHKESDESPWTPVDITEGTTESKHQRPARKRRWGATNLNHQKTCPVKQLSAVTGY